MGILDITDEDKSGAMNMGLLQAGLGILANNTNRYNPMQAIGQGGMMGLQGYQAELDRAQKRKLLDIEKAKIVRDAEQAKRQQTALKDNPQLQRLVDLGVPISELFKPHNVTEGGSLVAPGFGMLGAGGAPAPAGTTPQMQGGLPPGVIAQGQPKKTDVERLIAARDAAPVGSPQRATLDAAVTKATEFAPGADRELVDLMARLKDAPPGSLDAKTIQDRINILTTRAGPQSIINNIQPKADSAYATTLMQAQAKADPAQHDAALKAAQHAEQLKGVLNHLKTSKAITGPMADYQVQYERGKQLILGSKAAGQKVSDSQLLDAMLGADVFPMIKDLGIGARGLDTPAEREFLLKVMTGTLPMNKDTLIRMTELRQKYAQKAVGAWNDRVKSGELDPYFKFTRKPKAEIKVGDGWSDL